MEDFPVKLNSENLEEFLTEDSAFVDYFNTFLSLPDLDLLEQFSQKLMKDEDDNVQISSKPLFQQERTKHDLSCNTVLINYCVTVLDRRKGFEWVKKHRLPEFLKSELYAEYKLSKILSAAQVLYIDTIKNYVCRARTYDQNSQRRLPSTSGSSQLRRFYTSQEKCLNFESSDPEMVSNSDIESTHNYSESSIQMESTLDNSRNTTAADYPKQVGEMSNDYRYVRGNSDKNIKEVTGNMKNLATSDACTTEEQANHLARPRATVSCEEDGVSVGREYKNISNKTSKGAQALQKEPGRSDVLFKTSDNETNFFVPFIEKQNSEALEPDFRISDVEHIYSTDLLSNNSIDFNDGRSSEISQGVTENDVTDSDATGSDLTVENSGGKYFIVSNVMDSGVTSNITKREIVGSDVIFSDVIRPDVTSGGVGTDIRSSHNTNDIDGDASAHVKREDFSYNALQSKAKNVAASEEKSPLVSGGLLMSGKNCKSGAQDKNCRIFRNTDENLNSSNEDIVVQINDSETSCARIDSGTTETPNRNVVTDNEGFATFQGMNVVRIESDSNYENVERCNSHHENESMLKAAELKAMNSVEEGMLVEERSSFSLREMVGEKESHPNYNCIKFDENLKGPNDGWELHKQRRRIDDLKKEPKDDTYTSVRKTSMLPVEIPNRERVNVSDCEKINSPRAFTSNDANVKCHDVAGSHEESNSNGMLSKRKENLKQHESPDTRMSDLDGVSLDTNDNESGKSSLEVSPWGRESLQTFSSSDEVSDEKDKVKLGQEEGKKENSQVDLSTKHGMDKLREFLTNTKGETLLLFWLQVELWKHPKNEEEKRKIIEELKEKFLRNGSPLELPGRVKRHVKIFVQDLSEAQKIVAQPLRTYWCPRFTLHQLNTRSYDRPKHCCIVSNASNLPSRAAWTDVTPSCNVPSLPHFSTNPQLVRPHSASPRQAQAKERKNHVRSKSAQSRISTTPCHTNAGEKQLELYASPPPTQYGFQKRPIATFPSHEDHDYLAPVRLVINPLTKPRLRTAWSPSSEENRQSSQLHLENSQKNLFRESLVDALTYHTETGCFFEGFVKRQNNKLWLNCLSFWRALMEYSAYFEGDALNPVFITKKAQWIYSRFIAPGSLCDVQLGWKKEAEVRRRLEPPYEELFDVVEEHVLACLKEPWDSLCRNERREYDMVPKEETVRYLQVNLKPREGRGKDLEFMKEYGSHDEGEENSEKFSIEEANHPLPVPKDGVTFESVIRDRAKLEGFQKFLEKKDPKGVTDLMAWTDMETFQRIPRTMGDKRNKKAREIRDGYLNAKYFFGSNSPATKEAQNLIVSMNGSSRIKERPSTSIISECQKYVRCRIERRWLALYKQTQEYKERQDSKQNVSDVVEDIMLRRRLQRSEAAWRVLNSRWVSSSRDIVALRQTLNNPESCLAFRKFVALKGETYENDVLFWVEVQKYKDLCHRHASENCMKKKVQAITDCFINSSIPPELQIDVPIEMAEKLMERITSRNPNIGPYLFREVQMTVFRVLFNMWKEFCTFRSTVKNESLLEVLEKKLQQHRLEVRMKREASEKRKLAKQDAEKKRKEKEEKERKELKSMEQLVSLMTETSSWEHEEEDVVLWRYSKHLMANQTPPPVNKTSTQEETYTLIELANQRSRATQSTNNITNSVQSVRNTGKKQLAVSNDLKVVKGRSPVTESVCSNQTRRSQITKKSMNLLIPKIELPESIRSSNNMKRGNSVRKDKASDLRRTKDNQIERTTLLKNRRQKETKNVSDRETPNLVLEECRGKTSRTEHMSAEESRIEFRTVNDSRCKDIGTKDCRTVQPTKRSSSASVSTRGLGRSDTMSVTCERPGNSKVSVLRRQRQDSRGKNTSPVTLTSELLKDFTNSPEGAPLDIPLPLVKITESRGVDRNQSSLSVRRETKKCKNDQTSSRYGRVKVRKQVQDLIPDVIVN